MCWYEIRMADDHIRNYQVFYLNTAMHLLPCQTDLARTFRRYK